MIRTQKVFFPSLDTLRFLAFLAVFNQHAFRDAFDLEDKTRLSTKVVELLCNGALGVSFFFVLSGFLITYLILSEIRLNETLDVWHFYIRRSLRIWPLYFAVVTYGLVLYPLIKRGLGMDPTSASRTWMHYVFLSNLDKIHVVKYFPRLDVLMVGITWSVSVEEQFYLVWPLILKFVSRAAYHYVFITIVILSLAFRWQHQNDSITLMFHTFSVISDLAIGGLAAYHCLYNEPFLDFIRHLSKPAIVVVYLAGFAMLLNEGILLQSPPMAAIVRIPEAIFFAFIIVEQNFALHSFEKYSRWKPLARIGVFTYGLYLLHLVCIQLTKWAVVHVMPPSFASHLIAGALAFPLALVVGNVSYVYYEGFFLRLKTRFAYVVQK